MKTERHNIEDGRTRQKTDTINTEGGHKTGGHDTQKTDTPQKADTIVQCEDDDSSRLASDTVKGSA